MDNFPISLLYVRTQLRATITPPRPANSKSQLPFNSLAWQIIVQPYYFALQRSYPYVDRYRTYLLNMEDTYGYGRGDRSTEVVIVIDKLRVEILLTCWLYAGY